MKSKKLIAASLMSTVVLGAQDCPDRTRSLDLAAGTHNPGSVNCSPSVTITVGVLTVSSPTSCPTGYAEYLGTLYKCDVVTPLWKCGPQFKVPIHIYYGGKCPSINLSISGMSWSDWADVPAAIVQQFKCIEPKKRETFDWSPGKPVPCAGGDAGLGFVQGELIQAEDGTSYLLRRGEPELPGLQIVDNPFLTAYQQAQNGLLNGLPDLLWQAILTQGEVSSAKLSGEVTVRRIPAGSNAADYQDSIQFTGTITSSGKFDLASYSVAKIEDRPIVHTQRHTFDGLTYRQASAGVEFGNVYPVNYVNFDSSLRYVRILVDPLMQWMRDPAEIPRFGQVAGVDYTTEVETAEVHRLVEGHGTDIEYHFDRSASLPTISSVKYLKADGVACVKIECEKMTTIGGVRRPLIVRTTRVLADGEQIETTLSINEVSSVNNVTPATGWRQTMDWQVWQGS